MSLDRPDNDSLFTLAEKGYEAIGDAVTVTSDSTGREWNGHLQRTGDAVHHWASDTSAVVAAHGERLAVTFGDIDRVVRGLQTVNGEVAPIVRSVVALPGHPDLIASTVLSPVTAAGVVSAALGASVRISTALAASEALTLVAAAVVSTYQLADAALSTQIAFIGGAARVGFVTASGQVAVTGALIAGTVNTAGTTISTGLNLARQGETALFTLVGMSEVLLRVGVGSVAVGFGREVVDSYTEPLPNLFDGTDLPELLAVLAPITRFNLGDAWANTGSALQGTLGVTGPFFDDVLDRLIRSGRTFGLFHDGETRLVDQAPIDSGELRDRMGQTTDDSQRALDRDLVLDKAGAIVPRDVAELAASAGQVDNLGLEGFSAIRVITSVHDNEYSYLVVIPSTQQWWPVNGPAANDLTADLYTLAYGGSELGDAVLQAVRQAHEADGIQWGSASVTYSGFSLGGITAGTLAANPAAHASQVVTFGSPYANADIPDGVGVIAYEAKPDLVPTLDGANNPERWTTIRDNAPAIEAADPDGQGGTVILDAQDPSTHLANRYAAMAAEQPTTSHTLDDFFKGTLTVHDYYAVRQ